MSHSPRVRSALVTVVLAALLALLTLGSAHAYAHAGERGAAPDCSTCQIVKSGSACSIAAAVPLRAPLPVVRSAQTDPVQAPAALVLTPSAARAPPSL